MVGGNPNHPHAFTYLLTSYYLSHLHPKGSSSNKPKKDPCLGRGGGGECSPSSHRISPCEHFHMENMSSSLLLLYQKLHTTWVHLQFWRGCEHESMWIKNEHLLFEIFFSKISVLLSHNEVKQIGFYLCFLT